MSGSTLRSLKGSLAPSALCGLALLLGACPGEPEVEEEPAVCGNYQCEESESIVACPEDCYDWAYLDLELSPCRGDLSDAELEDQIAIALDFVESLGVLRDAWDFGNELSSSAVSVLVNLAYDPENDVIGAPFEFDEETGTYSRSLASYGTASLEVVFLFGADYEAGSAGTTILPYLFRTESYVEGASVEIGSWEATVSYTEPGPLVELIGLGPTPPNPFTLALLSALDETIRQRQRWAFHLDEVTPGGTAVRFDGSLEATLELGSVDQVPIELEELNVSRPSSGQQLAVADWSLLFDSEQELYGTAGFEVSGGQLEFEGLVGYWRSNHNGPVPELVLSCP